MARYSQVHEFANLAGPGDARPTADQVVLDEGLDGALEDKVILVTGINSGIGLETVRALSKTGANIYGTVRSVANSQHVLVGLPAEKIHLMEMQLDSLASIRAAAADVLAKTGGKLNILIANAGIMAVPEGRTQDGFEMQIGVNHLGHFLLFQLLREALLSSATPNFPSRVVTLTSSGHRGVDHVDFDNLMMDGNYDPWNAYGQSKLANVYMANEIERRFGPRNMHAWSVNPGGVGTALYKHLPTEQMQAFNTEENAKRFKSVEQGAASSVWAAVGRELNEGPYGRYIEDCAIVTETRGMDISIRPGYAPWAYDPENEKKLWDKSLKLVGLEE